MNQRKKVLSLIVGLLLVIVVMFLVEYLRGINQAKTEYELQPGQIPVYWNGKFDRGFSVDQLQNISQVSFVDAEEGKTQEGWLLKDVLMTLYKPDQFGEDSQIIVSSSSRQKSAQLTWDEVMDEKNMIMFDLSGRGTLKLISKLERLDVRDEWIQDVDKMEIINQ